MTHLLDINYKYRIHDKDEVFWKVVWEKIGNIEGWYLWKKPPGNTIYFCVGWILEEEAYKKLIETPKPLTEDDFIDLGLWLKDGLDQYAPDPNRVFEEPETETSEKSTESTGD